MKLAAVILLAALAMSGQAAPSSQAFSPRSPEPQMSAPPLMRTALLTAGPSATALRVADLPPDVAELLGFELSLSGHPEPAEYLADAGRPYRTTPMSSARDSQGRSYPLNRLIWGVQAGPYYVVHWERSVRPGTRYELNVYEGGPGGRRQLVWKGRGIVRPDGQGAQMADFAAFQRALGNGEVVDGGSRRNCVHPSFNLNVPVGVLQGGELGKRVTRLADLPPLVRAALPNTPGIIDGDTSLATPVAGQGDNSRLVWAQPLGEVWFAEVETVSFRSAGVRQSLEGTSELPAERRSYDLIYAFAPSQGRMERIFDSAPGPLESLERFRDLVLRTTPQDVRESIASGTCSRPGY